MKVIQDYRLCGECLQRQGSDPENSVTVSPKECFICEGLMEKVEEAGREVVRRIRRYQFQSFTLGLSVPPGVLEREDELRSNLKLQGLETIRTQTARLIGDRVSLALHKRLDKSRPDLTAVVNMADCDVSVMSKPLFYYGRYTKPPGIRQKIGACRFCFGAGCQKCRMTGLEKGVSVEGQLRRWFSRKLGTERMIFTWMGSEDKESRVFPPGRPFVVEVKNPVKRDLPGKFSLRSGRGTISVTRGRMLPSRPIGLPSFKFRTIIKATSAEPVGRDRLADVRRAFRRIEVRFDRPHEKPTTKTVYLAKAKGRGRNLVIEAVLDGGLPVKRFVSGELVRPSVSEVLKTEVRCRTFDICEVKETGEFGFAKITRL
jgi:tRNA pseudouridine synthase 10